MKSSLLSRRNFSLAGLSAALLAAGALAPQAQAADPSPSAS
jgi:hypothetical protein